ncbi:MAG: D-alanine--D-alanine ligase family protein [Pyrinomonadaceae bacterium]
MKIRVGVIFGGRSGEHEVSVRSAKTVLEQIDSSKYDAVPIAITNEGIWLDPSASLALFSEETQNSFRNRFGDPGHFSGLSSLLNRISNDIALADSSTAVTLDVLFPTLHGTFGEDGTIQGLFEMVDRPYVGCGVLASATGMDKAFMKTLFRDAGLPMCKYVWFLRSEWEANKERTLGQVASKIGFPCFVKPANLGSSVGITRATDGESLADAIAVAAEYDRKIIVEECVEMREIECAVIGNDLPEASLPGEYLIRDASKAFLDYTEKYSGTGNNEFVVPSPVSDELVTRIKQMTVTAFRAVDGSGLARVDFFLRNSDGALLVNEINTMPGLTDASGFPKMWAGSGKSFTQVIDELIDFAIDRYNEKKKNKTSFL